MNNERIKAETTNGSLTIGNTVLCAVNRNYVSPGDWVQTNDGTFAKIEKLEYREVYTDKGVIKKLDIKNVYVQINGV